MITVLAPFLEQDADPATLARMRDHVAAALRRYADAGIDSFILAGTPHVEECRRVARFVLPLLATVEAS